MTDPMLKMADILPMTPPPADPPIIAWGIVIAVSFITLLFLWRHYRNPYRQLLRQLAKPHISAREVAHQFARVLPLNSSLKNELDHLRFQTHSPSHSDLKALLQRGLREH